MSLGECSSGTSGGSRWTHCSLHRDFSALLQQGHWAGVLLQDKGTLPIPTSLTFLSPPCPPVPSIWQRSAHQPTAPLSHGKRLVAIQMIYLLKQALHRTRTLSQTESFQTLPASSAVLLPPMQTVQDQKLQSCTRTTGPVHQCLMSGLWLLPLL